MTLASQVALCRCGRSGQNPLCDGSHADGSHDHQSGGGGFDDAKPPDRVPDGRDTYVGQQVTIFDNRGICQRAGYCSDRLATVFRAGAEPFVAPSGGRMDETIRAVRDCPSGALSYAIDGVEARDEVDYHGARPPVVRITKDGPYRITGSIPLRNAEGGQPERAQGSSLEHYALCRCGQSQNKPFCSGMHWYAQHIRQLFRERDRDSMRFAFDLWSHDDVSRHADEILARVRNGTMPCDGSWFGEWVDLFSRWIDAGKPA